MAQYVLEILDGERAGEVVRLPERLRIGRKPVNDLVINDEKTSGVHAEVVLEGDRHVLRDLGSTNGTLMDGRKLNEVVLTPGDVFQAGRVRLCFRSEDAKSPGAGGGDEGAMLYRVDQAMLARARKPRSMWLLGALAAVVVGVAAWQFLGRGGDIAEGHGAKLKPPLEVAGNRLPGNVGACEDEQGWVLRGAGSGFAPAAPGHTGTGMFEAVRAPGDDGEGRDFALARLSEPITVLKDRPYTLQAHVRTRGNALVGVRLRLFAQAGNAPVFRTGTKLEPHANWERIECHAAVPFGVDRLEVELVAALPPDSAADVDDVALTEGGLGKAVELAMDTGGQKLIGTESSVAVTSTDKEQPVILYGVVPEGNVAALQGLFRAGLACLSDEGVSVSAEKTERGFALSCPGRPAMTLEFPAEATAGLLTLKADKTFQGAPADDFTATQLLLGDGHTRCLLVLASETKIDSKPAGARHRLRLEAERCELVLDFRAERKLAADLLRSAKAKAESEPGKALDDLRKLQNELPHDTETLRLAQGLRGELQQRLNDKLQQLGKDLEEATFFDTRGGFERVVLGIDDLVAVYGKHNLEDAEAVMKARATAQGRIRALDEARTAEAKKRLQELQRLFGQNGQADLAKLVQAYLAGNAVSVPEKKDPGSNGGGAPDKAPEDKTPDKDKK